MDFIVKIINAKDRKYNFQNVTLLPIMGIRMFECYTN